MEEQAGLRKPPTPVEQAANMYATAVRALNGMERMHPRPSEQVYKQRYFAQQGQDVESAIRKAMDEEKEQRNRNGSHGGSHGEAKSWAERL
jgi:hypothetical protein